MYHISCAVGRADRAHELRRFVTFYISALEILLLTYLLTYVVTGKATPQ